MKKIKIALTCLCVITALLLSSCQNSSTKALNSSNIKQSSNENITSSNSTMSLEGSYYEDDSDWFINNPIDNTYLKETPADTTIGISELQAKYLAIWQSEVAFSATNL